MSGVEVAIRIDAPPEEVWEEVRHIDRHVRWMADAESIAFTSPSRSGVGTTFDCLTKVGPVRLTDRMEITEWREGRTIGVRHVGVVTGTGRFTLEPFGRDRTRFTWSEHLRYPWWLGGPVGGVVGDRIMGLVWRRNLGRLKDLVESS